jgi:hypothetical protein
MMMLTPNGPVDLTALQERVAAQLKNCIFVTEDIKTMAELFSTLIEEMESKSKQLENLREDIEDVRRTMVYRDNI